jgi:hypothetical protein
MSNVITSLEKFEKSEKVWTVFSCLRMGSDDGFLWTVFHTSKVFLAPLGKKQDVNSSFRSFCRCCTVTILILVFTYSNLSSSCMDRSSSALCLISVCGFQHHHNRTDFRELRRETKEYVSFPWFLGCSPKMLWSHTGSFILCVVWFVLF